MVTVKIGQKERRFDEADAQWINQQINARRSAGESVCVRVTIRDGDVDMLLSTPTCGATAGGGRKSRPRENQIFELWNKRGLNESGFTGGDLIAFLKQLESVW